MSVVEIKIGTSGWSIRISRERTNKSVDAIWEFERGKRHLGKMKPRSLNGELGASQLYSNEADPPQGIDRVSCVMNGG